ncbi:GNAT family N-acetyltransferase [Halalkalibacterium halodurans]|uniref:N-acetyltransferase domain-containing protein n=1 Tax=Halalkalibacterium halodurans TaxID=86665 RepID=A0A0M0KJP3_ALKHA|nr:GNAT family protein [Halalkalibacterium halodurans]MDY7222504.1 GNAT family protein [Halalkalibacterium halodurans]MDY7241725.1 GNAT family protein [Halalkalibacterium halodurans]TES53304.1 N-acetyltransferase [Halalkalibacterium halodurans]TPE67905.1 GNAT family N-acetyltransferase [Halalkalibacterium halodurans]
MLLETPELRLRKTTTEDLAFVLKLEAIEENKRYIIPWDERKHQQTLEDRDCLHLMIESKKAGKTVGYVILHGVHNENDSIELVRLTIHDKEKGFGQQVLSLMKQWVFTEAKANRLWLDVKTNNARAMHVYEKQGFVLEGTLRECLKSKYGFESLNVMSVLKSEYEEEQKKKELL